jgi:hypothetical protein
MIKQKPNKQLNPIGLDKNDQINGINIFSAWIGDSVKSFYSKFLSPIT